MTNDKAARSECAHGGSQTVNYEYCDFEITILFYRVKYKDIAF